MSPSQARFACGTQPVTSELGRLPDIQALDCSRDGKILVTGGDDGVVRLRHAALGGEIRSIPAHLDAVRAVAFSPDGKWVASAGGPCANKKNWSPEWEIADRSVRLWDVRNGRARAFPRATPEAFVQEPALPVRTDGRFSARMMGERPPGGPSQRAGCCRPDFLPQRVALSPPEPLAFSPDGRMLVASADYHEVRFLDAADFIGTELRCWPDEIKRCGGPEIHTGRQDAAPGR